MTFPLGPFHPALPEPLALRLALRGERVTGVDVHTGYLTRGIETIATMRDLDGLLDLVEHTCPTCGAGYRLACCLALEAGAGVTPPPLAQSLRVVFAELERALARLWFLQTVARAGDFGSLFQLAVEIREQLFDAAEAATGRRLCWGIAIPGGVRSIADPSTFGEVIDDLDERIDAIERLVGRKGQVGRALHQIAVVDESTATDLGLTGVLLRATGVDDDLRVSAPYAAYSELTKLLEWDASDLTGDTASRLRVAVRDLRVSCRIMLAVLESLPGGQERAPFPAILSFTEAYAAIEAARGRGSVRLRLGGGLGHAVDHATPGWLAELSLQTPGAVNAGIVPIVCNGQQLSDIPVALAGLDLCIACTDR